MVSFSEILARHAPLLVIDTASARSQVGWVEAANSGRWIVQDGEAGISLFECVDRLMIDVSTARGFVFCEGPGSILGIRTAAMAIRTWRILNPIPVFSYGSLAILAHALGKADATVIADARRNTWHAQNLDGSARRVAVTELSGELITPKGFRAWSSLPEGTSSADYNVENLILATASSRLFKEVAHPDAFLHDEPDFAPWTPKVHRAPEVSR